MSIMRPHDGSQVALDRTALRERREDIRDLGASARAGAESAGPLIDRIERRGHRLTPSDRELAFWCTQNYTQLAFESATAMGKRLGLSPGTVIRFFMKLGYESFADVRREVQDAIATRLRRAAGHQDGAAGEAREVQEDGTADAAAVLRRSLSADVEALGATLALADGPRFPAFVDALAAADRIYVIGEEAASGIAHP